MNSGDQAKVAFSIFAALVCLAVLLKPGPRALVWRSLRTFVSILLRQRRTEGTTGDTEASSKELRELIVIVSLGLATSILGGFVINAVSRQDGPDEPVGTSGEVQASESLETSATPSPSSSGLRQPPPILFSVGSDFYYDLKVLVPDGSNFLDATPEKRDGIADVDVTADGRIIGCAFERRSDPSIPAFIFAELGTDNQVRNLVDLPVPKRYGCAQPSWSPEGQEVAFTCVGEASTVWDSICIFNIHSPSQVERLPSAFNFAYAPEWSLDGQALVIAGKGGFQRTGVFLVDRHTGQIARRLAYFGQDADLSPDGTRVAFGTNRGLYVAETKGAGVSQRISTGAAGAPSWSPDGRQIAFVPFFGRTAGSVVVIDARTGREKVLFRAQPGEGSVFDLAWLPAPS
jgi:WD40 repeat protein